jgi:multiple antibiotic resistance protein
MGSTEAIGQRILILVSIILTFVLCLFGLFFSRRIHKFIGYNGMLVFTRLMGLLLAALAVNLTSKGLINIFNLT